MAQVILKYFEQRNSDTIDSIFCRYKFLQVLKLLIDRLEGMTLRGDIKGPDRDKGRSDKVLFKRTCRVLKAGWHALLFFTVKV